MKNIYQAMKPEGPLIIAHALSSEEIKVHHKRASLIMQDHLPEKAEIKRLLTCAGFKEIYIEDESRSYLCLSTKQ